jgi:hypothetical protein
MNGGDRGAVLGGSGNPKVAVVRDFECEPILHFVRLSLLSTVSSDVEAKLNESTVDPKMVSGGYEADWDFKGANEVNVTRPARHN